MLTSDKVLQMILSVVIIIDAILVLWEDKLSLVVHRLNISPHQNSNSSNTQTAVKIKLVFAQLITHYLDGTTVVSKKSGREQSVRSCWREQGWTTMKYTLW